MIDWFVVLFLFSCYTIYYVLLVAKRPILVSNGGPFSRFLHDNVPILKTRFCPTFWFYESRFQTMFCAVFRSQKNPDISYRRELLTLNDGGVVALDWLERDCTPDAPIIIILPGITGHSQSEYIKCFVMAANRIGLRMVVYTNRGLGEVELKTRRLYGAANCEDVSQVVNHVANCNPSIRIGAAGISVGGLILGNYLINYSEEAGRLITATKMISVPWDVQKGTASLEKPILNNLMCRSLTSTMCTTVGKFDILRDSARWDMDHVLRSKTIKEFDARLTSKIFGFDSVDTYYDTVSIHDKMHRITVPLLCLTASDDPFQPLDAVPIKQTESIHNVAIAITAYGGHLGFLEGWWPSSTDQYMVRLFSQYFNTTLFDNNGHFKETTQIMLKEQQRMTKIE